MREIDGEVSEAVILRPVSPNHVVLYLTVPTAVIIHGLQLGEYGCVDRGVLLQGEGVRCPKELGRVVIQVGHSHDDGDGSSLP